MNEQGIRVCATCDCCVRAVVQGDRTQFTAYWCSLREDWVVRSDHCRYWAYGVSSKEQETKPWTTSEIPAATPQPPPQPGQVAVGQQVLADIQSRIDMGYQKYGTLLQTHNGRDALWDAYQEAIDLVMYLRQAILERDSA